ncbi:hypothetical protein GCM10007096_07040 [Pullulanibacillus pueri]|uniref:Uncharacterized protein n=1 Tax=Pullulanibacillus pueri TaxID=1437324 RepID=A0A8J2ZTF4_9BACL|nr:hypothetical protein GCM10007096_07040 [Pullulanibacillus pueri]
MRKGVDWCSDKGGGCFQEVVFVKWDLPAFERSAVAHEKALELPKRVARRSRETGYYQNKRKGWRLNQCSHCQKENEKTLRAAFW